MVCDKTPACGRFAPFDYQCCWINNLLDDHDLDSSSSSISGVPVGLKYHNRSDLGLIDHSFDIFVPVVPLTNTDKHT